MESQNNVSTIRMKDIFQKMSEVEVKLGFYEFFYKGIPIWTIVRERAGNLINGANLSGQQTVSQQPVKIFNLLGRFFYFVKNFYKIFGNEIIFFSNERHLQKDPTTGLYYNSYGELIEENFSNKKMLIFEFPTPMTTRLFDIKYQRYLPMDPFLILKQLFSPLSIFFNNKVEKEFKSKILDSSLWSKKDAEEILLMLRYAAFSLFFYDISFKMIKLLNPNNKVFYSCMGGYDKIQEVIEIQHGVIFPFHSQYIFPRDKKLETYLSKKKMIVFSKKINGLLINSGYNRDNLKIASNPKIKYYFLKNKEKIFSNNFEREKVLFIGDWGGNVQNILSHVLSKIEADRENLKDYEFSLVLHPTEKDIYSKENFSKVKIFENHQVSLWDKILESFVVITVFSSVAEEASYFGCFNLILKDRNFNDQLEISEALCGDYPYKEIIEPEDFIGWLHKKNNLFSDQKKVKESIIKNNYDIFNKKDYIFLE